MITFIEFIKEYKEFIIGALTLIISIVLIFIKRRPKTVDDFISSLDEVCNVIPSLIIKAEVPGNGLAKKKEVLSDCFSILKKHICRDLSKFEYDLAYKKFDSSIELILSTPQKKAVEVC